MVSVLAPWYVCCWPTQLQHLLGRDCALWFCTVSPRKASSTKQGFISTGGDHTNQVQPAPTLKATSWCPFRARPAAEDMNQGQHQRRPSRQSLQDNLGTASLGATPWKVHACTCSQGPGPGPNGIRPFAPILLECGLDIYQRVPTSTIHQSKGGHHSLVESRTTHARL